MANINLDKSSRLDIKCRKGDTFKITLTFDADQSTARPVGGWQMEVRETADDNSGSPIIPTSSVGFVYNVGGTELTITIAASIMNLVSGQYVYDLQHKSTDATPIVETFLHGVFTVIEDITLTT